MSNFFKYTGLTAILLFSFYYTEVTANFVKSKTPLMMTINEEAKNLRIKSVNAEIKDGYITPGINGLEVNASKSYVNMKKIGDYNEYYLIFDQIVPKTSITNNLDKIIKKGNKEKNGVSIILENNNNEIIKYFETLMIKVNLLIDVDSFNKNSFFEQINNDHNNFNALDKSLKRNKINNNLCIINNDIKEQCINSKYYLIEPTYTINNANINNIKNNITSGDILLINNTVTTDNINIILRQIKIRDLKILLLSELISEYKDN